MSNAQPERVIRNALYQVSLQRVPLVLQPGNVWVIDNAVSNDPDTHAALMTCFMRGWIEPVHHAVPHGKLTPDGQLPKGKLFTEEATIYRVTPAGWAIINRTHGWSVLAVAISALSFAVAVASFMVAIMQHQGH